jgi:hypothetical protein
MTDELDRIGVEGRAQHLGRARSLEPFTSHQIAEIIGIAKRNRPADDRHAAPGSSWIFTGRSVSPPASQQLGTTPG